MDLHYFRLDLQSVHNLQPLFSLCEPQPPFHWPTNSWPSGFEKGKQQKLKSLNIKTLCDLTEFIKKKKMHICKK